MRIIDGHVHLRDEDWRHKSTIAEGLKLAKKSNVYAVVDMPNLPNPVTTRERVFQRLSLAKKSNSSVSYATYIGITAEPRQIREAVETQRELFPYTIGLKLFAGKSTGNLAVIDEKDQERIYRVLSDYRGVLTVHCEKESYLKPQLWNPSNPISHCAARPPEAELTSIEDQVRFAYDSSFQGTLNIAHITTPEAVKYVNDIRKHGGAQFGNIKITCEVTPHHLFIHDKMMNEKDGIMLKVNPPLRSQKDQEGLLECLMNGEIDWIATDHAPHTLDEKTGKALDENEKPIYASGIPGLQKWPGVLNRLRQMNMSEKKIENLAFWNFFRTFRLNEKFLRNG